MGASPGWYPDPNRVGWQRYFDGSRWTPNYAPFAALPPVSAQPGGASGVQAWLRGSPWRTVALGIAAVVVIGFAVSIFLSSRRDEASYNAGYDYGTHYAHSVILKARAGIEPPLNYKIEFDCGVAGGVAAEDGYNGSDGSHIDGNDIDDDDFKAGCVASARPTIRSQYNEH